MIAIVAALEDELKSIREELTIDEHAVKHSASFVRGHLHQQPVLLLQTGVGQEAMLRAMTWCLETFTPNHVLHVGFSGAADPTLCVGDLVVARGVIDAVSGMERRSDAQLFDRALTLCSHNRWRWHEGNVLTVHELISDPHEKAFVGTKHGASAIDMESAALAQACDLHHVPFLLVRAILDPLDMHLPLFGDTIDETGAVHAPLLTAHLLRNPRHLLELPKLAYAASKAREAIAQFINEWVPIDGKNR